MSFRSITIGSFVCVALLSPSGCDVSSSYLFADAGSDASDSAFHEAGRDASMMDAPPDENPPMDAILVERPTSRTDSGDASPPTVTWCSLGADVPGAQVAPGFCMRKFAGAPEVTEPRTLAFSPNGDLFVGSPQYGTPGGAGPGRGAILVLADDNVDGVAEVGTFLGDVNDVHALTFGPDALYFTVSDGVMQTPYTVGQRMAVAAGTRMFTSTAPGQRFTHGLARSALGWLFYSYSSFASSCPDTGSGAILAVAGGSAITVASGFRNPMYMRCHPHDDVCLATELGDDGGGSWGAHEKLLVVRPTTDFGFPCCATTSAPSPTVYYPCCGGTAASCASVTSEEVSFPLNDTPFGMDWERGVWPAPYNGVVCVAKHGSFYSSPQWRGAGIFCAPTDPTTHVPNGPFAALITGFAPGAPMLARPADVAFAPDGRMFIADDMGNAIYWVAPRSLLIPAM